MRSLNALLLAVLIISNSLGTGCNKLTLENARKVRDGVTTDAEIKAIFGDPKFSETYDTEGVKILNQRFFYQGTANIGPVAWLEYYFLAVESKNGINIGHLYASNEGNNATLYDQTKLDQIKEGVTTRTQVIQLLGQPNGIAFKNTKIEEIKKADAADGVVTYLVWVNAPPVSGLMGFLKAETTTLILQFNASDKMIRKTVLTQTIRF